MNIQPGASEKERIIFGSTEKGTDVFIFLDGLFVGSAQPGRELGADKIGFSFYLKRDIKLDGRTVTALARDSKTLIISDYSASVVISGESGRASGEGAKEVPAPTLVSPNISAVIGKSRPTIFGFARGGNNVEIYIDGVYAGDTGTTSDKLFTASFTFVPASDLAVGQHQVYAVAKNDQGQRSTVSELLIFNIGEKLPAPILEDPIINLDNSDLPLFVGLTYSNTSVFVYVDDQLIGQAKVENRDSGVTSFAYQLQQPLTRGGHLVYTVAIDKKGKESDHSNYVYFFAGENLEPVITEEAVTDIAEAQNESDNELAAILDQKGSTDKDSGGMINEAKEKQAALKWNIVVFLAFLLAVIGWIFWVNRELIKEKRKQNQSDNKSAEENKQDKLI